MSARRVDGPLSCKVYVGGLPDRASRTELEEIFGRYGPLRDVWVARRPPGFAFIQFQDTRDAEDACRGLDGTRMCGVRARVEMSSDRRRGGGGGRGSNGDRRDGSVKGGRGYDRYDNDRPRYASDRNDGDKRQRSPPVRRPSSRSRSRSGGKYSPQRRRNDSRSPSPIRNRRSSPYGNRN